MPALSMYMIVKIIGEPNVNLEEMMLFVLSVRKSYRENPYHNFEHAFNVCHCMYSILMRNMEQFTVIEVSFPHIYKYIIFANKIERGILPVVTNDFAFNIT